MERFPGNTVKWGKKKAKISYYTSYIMFCVKKKGKQVYVYIFAYLYKKETYEGSTRKQS